MTTETRATTFLWRAAGSPVPTATDGAPIAPRPEIAAQGAVCAACGERAAYRLADAISDHFTTVSNASRAWPHRSEAVCAGCLWCCRSLALRCAPFFATQAGFWFFGSWSLKGIPSSRPDAMAMLLAPPEPPFVACFPLAGVEHGGEDALERTMFAPPQDELVRGRIERLRAEADEALHLLLVSRPDDVKPEDAKRRAMRGLVTGVEPWPSRLDWAAWLRLTTKARGEPWWRFACWPLVKLQSKHTALYARVSESRERYWLQVDDAGGFLLDVALWQRLRGVAGELLLDLRAQGVGAREAEEAVRLIARPFGYRVSERSWRAFQGALVPHAGAVWWSLFVSLLPMPPLPAR
jgi:hypothetical protein